MAVPTISSVTPNASRTGGRILATIAGTNFRVQTAPPSTGPTAPLAPSMRVTFGSTVSPEVAVISSTLAYALVPPADPGTVSLTVQNLDANGALISGEAATRASAFTYSRPSLVETGHLTFVLRTLLLMLTREVLDNVVLTQHTEFDGDTLDNMNILPTAKLPVVILVGPRLPVNRFYARNTRRIVPDGSGKFNLLRPSETHDIVLTLVGATDHTQQLTNLQQVCSSFFARNPFIEVLRDKDNPSAGVVRYEMQLSFDGFVANNRANESNVRQFQGEFVIRGVDLDEPNMVIAKTSPAVDYDPAAVAAAAGVPLPTITLADGKTITLEPVSYTEEEAVNVPQWPVILGSDPTSPVTPTSTPSNIDFEQYKPTGDDEP